MLSCLMPLLPTMSKQEALAYRTNLAECLLELLVIHLKADALNEYCPSVMLDIGAFGRHDEGIGNWKVVCQVLLL